MGQINRGSEFGEIIYNLAKDTNLKTFVDIGTWDGTGSTKCFLDGLFERTDGYSFFTLEANKEFYDRSFAYWQPFISLYRAYNKVHFLYGRLIDESELISEEEIKKDPRFSQHPFLEWRNRNIKEYNECENVLSKLPEVIDVLLLDGGQFSTRAEWNLLKNKTNIVLLDDTTTFKTDKIREEIISNNNEWEVIRNSFARNGFFVAQRIKKIDR